MYLHCFSILCPLQLCDIWTWVLFFEVWVYQGSFLWLQYIYCEFRNQVRKLCLVKEVNVSYNLWGNYIYGKAGKYSLRRVWSKCGVPSLKTALKIHVIFFRRWNIFYKKNMIISLQISIFQLDYLDLLSSRIEN